MKTNDAKSFRHYFLPAIIIFAALLAALVGCGAANAATGANGTTVSPAANGQETYTVKKVTAENNIEISGHVQPLDSKTMSFPKSGRVEQVFVQERSVVQKGALLAKLHSSDAEYNLKNIQNQIETQRIAGATREVELLLLQQRSAEQSLEDCYLRAPFAGIVSEAEMAAGDMVGSGSSSSYIKVIDISRYQAVVEIDELDAVMVKVGQKTQVTFDALPGKTFSGEVRSIPVEGKVGSQSIGVLDIVIVFSGLPEEIKTGFSFSGQIVVSSSDEVLIIPKTAVLQRNGKSVVMFPAKEGGQPERREVTVSDYSTEFYKVEAGLAEGETIMAAIGAQSGSNSSDRERNFMFQIGPEGGGPAPEGGNIRRNMLP